MNSCGPLGLWPYTFASCNCNSFTCVWFKRGGVSYKEHSYKHELSSATAGNYLRDPEKMRSLRLSVATVLGRTVDESCTTFGPCARRWTLAALNYRLRDGPLSSSIALMLIPRPVPTELLSTVTTLSQASKPYLPRCHLFDVNPFHGLGIGGDGIELKSSLSPLSAAIWSHHAIWLAKSSLGVEVDWEAWLHGQVAPPPDAIMAGRYVIELILSGGATNPTAAITEAIHVPSKVSLSALAAVCNRATTTVCGRGPTPVGDRAPASAKDQTPANSNVQDPGSTNGQAPATVNRRGDPDQPQSLTNVNDQRPVNGQGPVVVGDLTLATDDDQTPSRIGDDWTPSADTQAFSTHFNKGNMIVYNQRHGSVTVYNQCDIHASVNDQSPVTISNQGSAPSPVDDQAPGYVRNTSHGPERLEMDTPSPLSLGSPALPVREKSHSRPLTPVTTALDNNNHYLARITQVVREAKQHAFAQGCDDGQQGLRRFAAVFKDDRHVEDPVLDLVAGQQCRAYERGIKFATNRKNRRPFNPPRGGIINGMNMDNNPIAVPEGVSNRTDYSQNLTNPGHDGKEEGMGGTAPDSANYSTLPLGIIKPASLPALGVSHIPAGTERTSTGARGSRFWAIRKTALAGPNANQTAEDDPIGMRNRIEHGVI